MAKPPIPRFERPTEVAQWRMRVNSLFENRSNVTTPPITGDYEIQPFDDIIWVDATAGLVTITLPPAADLPGKTYVIEKIDETDNEVRVMAQTGETVNGDPYFDLLEQWESVDPTSTGTGYYI